MKKKKKLTREQAERLLEKKFGDIEVGDYVHGLCGAMPIELQDDFHHYWKEINTEGWGLMPAYLPEAYRYTVEASLLRLLTAHIFIRDTYKKGRK